LEDALSEKLFEENLEAQLPRLDETSSIEINFEPITPKKSVSELVEIERRRREKSVS
jgi:hypothetical protein